MAQTEEWIPRGIKLIIEGGEPRIKIAGDSLKMLVFAYGLSAKIVQELDYKSLKKNTSVRNDLLVTLMNFKKILSEIEEKAQKEEEGND